jgi:hypothetical protein
MLVSFFASYFHIAESLYNAEMSGDKEPEREKSSKSYI